jgi:hypothetical protein
MLVLEGAPLRPVALDPVVVPGVVCGPRAVAARRGAGGDQGAQAGQE